MTNRLFVVGLISLEQCCIKYVPTWSSFDGHIRRLPLPSSRHAQDATLRCLSLNSCVKRKMTGVSFYRKVTAGLAKVDTVLSIS